MSGKRRFRPGPMGLLGMIGLNALAAALVLKFVFVLFGVVSVVSASASAMPLAASAARWQMLWPMVPAAAIGFGCLWFWLILTGRSRGLNWGSAFMKGIIIGYADVLCGGLIVGALHGEPARGLLLGLVMLLLVPAVWAAMAVFGLIMALFNANMAARWITRHRPVG